MGILDLVFPKSCLGCGTEGAYICSDCVAKVKLAKPICAYCEKASIDGFTHVKCRKKLGLDGLTSVWEYEGVIRKAVLALKYKYATDVGDELIRWLTDSLKKLVLPLTLCLVPVPMYWYKQNTRGFNQSVEMGRALASEMKWKFMPDLLIKKKSTTSQAQLSGEARRQNLKGVFVVDSRFEAPDSILLFDDVFTTGSTLREAAKVLKRAGVAKVWGLTIAR